MNRTAIGILSVLLAAAGNAQPADGPNADAPADPATQPAEDTDDSAAPGRGFFSGTYRRAERPHWNAEAEANVWYVSPGGDLSLGGSQLVDTARLNVDSPRATPMLEVHGRFDPFTVSLRGSLLDVDGTSTLVTPTNLGAVTFASGETVSTSYRLDEAVLRVGYRLYQFDADANRRGRPLLSAGVDVLGGLRLYDGSIGVAGPSGSAGASFTHVEPLIGFAADVAFADRYEIQFQNTHAGTPEIDGQRSFTVDVQLTFKYRPIDNAAIQLGYRIRRNLLEGKDFEIDGAVAGLFAGLTLRF